LMIVMQALAVYAGIGLIVGLAFVLSAVARVLPHAVPVSPGARVLLLPGAVILWPYVLLRWLRTRR
jgi:hypothetical protein